MLISAMVGLDLRSTLDMDATIKGIDLSESKLSEVLSEIIDINVDDDVSFEIISIKSIMNEADYSGYGVTIKGYFDTMYVNFTIDISTGDVITPREVKYKFKLLFQDKDIEVLAYNLETVISEKIHSIITRGVTNTRARDYYDIYILTKFQSSNYDTKVLKEAIINKFKSRDSVNELNKFNVILEEIEGSKELEQNWINYTKKFQYAKDISYQDVVNSVKKLCKILE